MPGITHVTSGTVEKKITEEFVTKVTQGAAGGARGLGGARMLRGAHPRHHGIVRAEFRLTSDVAPDLRKGLFATAKPYKVYVRFLERGRCSSRWCLPIFEGWRSR